MLEKTIKQQMQENGEPPICKICGDLKDCFCKLNDDGIGKHCCAGKQ